MMELRGNRFWARMILAVFAAAVFTSCGKDEPVTPRYGSTVEVQPESESHNALGPAPGGSCYDNSTMVYTTFRVTVLDSDGNPVNNASLAVQAPYSFGSGIGLPTIMYVIDGDTGYPVLSYPYNTFTGENGTKDITLLLDLTCSWGPVTVSVFSGAAYDKIDVTVN